VQGLVLGKVEGDLEVSGLVHVEAPPPPAPTVADVQTGDKL